MQSLQVMHVFQRVKSDSSELTFGRFDLFWLDWFVSSNPVSEVSLIQHYFLRELILLSDMMAMLWLCLVFSIDSVKFVLVS